jgi:hypothetical protein
MKDNIENLEKKTDDIQFLSDDEISDLSFYEACFYLEKLNVLDNFSNGGDSNE